MEPGRAGEAAGEFVILVELDEARLAQEHELAFRLVGGRGRRRGGGVRSGGGLGFGGFGVVAPFLLEIRDGLQVEGLDVGHADHGAGDGRLLQRGIQLLHEIEIGVKFLGKHFPGIRIGEALELRLVLGLRGHGPDPGDIPGGDGVFAIGLRDAAHVEAGAGRNLIRGAVAVGRLLGEFAAEAVDLAGRKSARSRRICTFTISLRSGSSGF